MDAETARQLGLSAGQISLGEFILKDFGDELPEMVEKFIREVLKVEYEAVAKLMNMHSEDIALEVDNLYNKVKNA